MSDMEMKLNRAAETMKRIYQWSASGDSLKAVPLTMASLQYISSINGLSSPVLAVTPSLQRDNLQAQPLLITKPKTPLCFCNWQLNLDHGSRRRMQG